MQEHMIDETSLMPTWKNTLMWEHTEDFRVILNYFKKTEATLGKLSQLIVIIIVSKQQNVQQAKQTNKF